MKKLLLSAAIFILGLQIQAAYLYIPMDDTQKNHLKSYGIAYWILTQDVEVGLAPQL